MKQKQNNLALEYFFSLIPSSLGCGTFMVFPISCAKHKESVVAVGGDCYHSMGSTSDRKHLDEKKTKKKSDVWQIVV